MCRVPLNTFEGCNSLKALNNRTELKFYSQNLVQLQNYQLFDYFIFYFVNIDIVKNLSVDREVAK